MNHSIADLGIPQLKTVSSAPAPSAITTNGLTTASGGSFLVESADNNE
jgi:hypothetical protein